MNYFFTIVIILMIYWIYKMQYYYLEVNNKIFVDDLKDLKTGDMILFKAYNNFYSIIHGSYFGHVGMVYIDKITGIPMIFEANGVESTPLKEHHPKNGIFLTPLSERIKKYKGRCFIKRLKKPLSDIQTENFKDFIEYTKDNFHYDYCIAKNALKKLLGYKRCDKNTDCGQLAFLSLICMELLEINEYDDPIFNHLLYVNNLYELKNNSYTELEEIIDHPFAE